MEQRIQPFIEPEFQLCDSHRRTLSLIEQNQRYTDIRYIWWEVNWPYCCIITICDKPNRLRHTTRVNKYIYCVTPLDDSLQSWNYTIKLARNFSNAIGSVLRLKVVFITNPCLMCVKKELFECDMMERGM